LKKCKFCGKEFEGESKEFCSWECSEAKMSELKKRLKEAVNKDKGHTEEFSN
jgi:predicted nucleic acid-binding Zn ribbon protein